jgi:peptidoglycan hydrolase CwlO-like protein
LKGNEDLLNRIDQLRSNIANISSKIADRNTEIVFSKKSMNRLEKEKMYSDKEFIK